MGSWSETCALSNLPITIGDEVVWLLLTKNPYADNGTGCYFNDYFFVRSVPIFGKYDDYGEMAPGENEGLFLELVKQQFALDLMRHEQNERDKTCGIPAVDMADFSFGQLQNWLHEGHVRIDGEYLYTQANIRHNKRTRESIEHVRAYCAHDTCPTPLPDKSDFVYKMIKPRHDDWKAWVANELKQIETGGGLYHLYPEEALEFGQKPKPVCRIMVRKDIWDSLCSLQLETWQSVLTLEKIKNDADAYLAKTLEGVAEEKTLDAEKVRRNRMLREYGDEAFRRNSFMQKFGGMGGVINIPYGMHVGEVRKTVVDNLYEGTQTEDVAREIFHRMCELGFIEDILSMGRMNWGPTTGAGSQGQEFGLSMEVHLRMARCAYEAAAVDAKEADDDEYSDREDGSYLEDVNNLWARLIQGE